MSDPTIPEVMRRLDEIARSVERLVNTVETSYVRRDVYEAKHEALRNEVNGKAQDIYGDLKEMKLARQQDIAYKRQISAGAAILIIGVLINLGMGLFNIIARAAS